MTLPAAERFEHALAALIGKQALRQDRFALAVSGGPDSMALMLLAHQVLPGRIAAATVDHGLRAEAADEAAMVAGQCAMMGIAHATLRPDQPITGNIQASARSVRYALLHQWRAAQGCPWLLTAHHGDDQRETVLMRLARGSGVAGLAGIRARNGEVLRPLLGFAKAELAALCADHGLTPVDDPSNASDDFDRVRWRKMLATTDLDLPLDAIRRSAMACDQANEALNWMVNQLAETRLRDIGQGWTVDADALPPELRRRLLIAALARLAPDAPPPRGTMIETAITRLDSGENAMIGALLVQPKAGHWTISLAPPRKSGIPPD